MRPIDPTIAAVSLAVSAALLVATWALARQVLLRLPRDYLIHVAKTSPGRRLARAFAGVGLIAIGVLLLILPGPGILCVLVGASLLPGTAPWARWALRHPSTLRRVNSLRVRHGLPPLTPARSGHAGCVAGSP